MGKSFSLFYLHPLTSLGGQKVENIKLSANSVELLKDNKYKAKLLPLTCRANKYTIRHCL